MSRGIFQGAVSHQLGTECPCKGIFCINVNSIALQPPMMKCFASMPITVFSLSTLSLTLSRYIAAHCQHIPLHTFYNNIMIEVGGNTLGAGS